MPSVVCALVVVMFGLTCSTARAYCRATTSKPAKCHEPCVTTGTPLAWRSADVHYSFREGGFGDELDEDRARAVFAAAFETWSNVTCADGPPGFRFLAETALTTRTVGPRLAEPNENVLWLPDEQAWDELDYDPDAYAVTETWYDVTGATIGRIRGGDMSFNPRMGPWLDCDGPCAFGNDLRNVATHEIGHLLGLSHSETAGSTMWCDARDGELEKRTLGADDVAGLCAAYEDVELARPRPPRDCSVGTGPSEGAWMGGLLVALGLWLRGRRRAPLCGSPMARRLQRGGRRTL